MSALTLADAQKVVEAGVAKARELGLVVTVAVVDRGLHLVALVRMDGAPPLSPEIGRGKAMASAAFGVPSAALAERAATPVLQRAQSAAGGLLVPSQGALPLQRDGATIGGVGVSGALPAEDEQIADAAVAALGQV